MPERAEGEVLAAERLLPLVPGLLAQGDPMPLFTLKLTCAVLDAAPAAALPVLQRRAPRRIPCYTVLLLSCLCCSACVWRMSEGRSARRWPLVGLGLVCQFLD